MKQQNGKPYLVEAFKDMKKGEIRYFSLDDVNYSSVRTRAGELNMDAGYTQYSVSIDRLLNQVRIVRNG